VTQAEEPHATRRDGKDDGASDAHHERNHEREDDAERAAEDGRRSARSIEDAREQRAQVVDLHGKEAHADDEQPERIEHLGGDEQQREGLQDSQRRGAGNIEGKLVLGA
jgi:hypothetical protein